MKSLMLVLVSAVMGLSAFAQDLPFAGSQKVISCFELTDPTQPQPESIMYFELLLSTTDTVESALVLVLDTSTGNPVAGDDLSVSSVILNGAEVSFNSETVNSNLDVVVFTQYVGVQTYTDENGQEVSVPVYNGTASISDTRSTQVISLFCGVEYL